MLFRNITSLECLHKVKLYKRAHQPYMVIGLLLFVSWAFFYSANRAIDVPTFHMDGAFQTASGLLRLDAGQAPGKDFYPYLGIGPILIIYPLFKIFGGDLAASVLSTQLITLLFGWISISIAWLLVLRPERVKSAFVGGALIFILPSLVKEIFPFFPDLFRVLIEPGNSIRPIRAAIPSLVAAVYYLLICQCKNTTLRSILFGAVIGVAMLWSNDYSIPTAGLFSILYCCRIYISEPKSRWLSIIIFGLASVIFWIFTLSLVTMGHPVEILKYNFLDVAKDQWWYFSSYKDSDRIFEITDLSKLISHQNWLPLIVLLVCSIFAVKTKKDEIVLITCIGLSLFSGGALASIGGNISGYFWPFICWGCYIVIFGFLNIVNVLLRRPEDFYTLSDGPSWWIHVVKTCSSIPISLRSSLVNFVNFLVPLFAVVVLCAVVTYEWVNLSQNKALAKNDSDRFYVDGLGGYLASEWRGYINYIQDSEGRVVLEDYWGVWGALNHSFSPWPVDSIIHALGSVREDAKIKMKDAEIIISTKQSFAPLWQPWTVSQNFWFYEELLRAWTPDFVTPNSIVWRRLKEPRKFKEVKCHIAEKRNGFFLKDEAEGFYSVSLKYKILGSGRYLLMVRNNISFAGHANGYVSLPLVDSSVTFPLLLNSSDENFFDIRVHGSKSVEYIVESCTAKRISYENIEVLNKDLRPRP